MASKAQVAAKAAKLGASFQIIDNQGAHLGAPAGLTFEGYHTSYVEFYHDGKQAVWDDFWGYLKNLEPCPFEGCTCGEVIA